MQKLRPSIPENVAFFGKRAFADVQMRSRWSRAGPESVIGVPVGRDAEAHAGEGGRGTTEPGIGMMPPGAKGRHAPPWLPGTREWEQTPLGAPRERAGLLSDCCSPDWGRTRFCCFKPPHRDSLLRQPENPRENGLRAVGRRQEQGLRNVLTSAWPRSPDI